MVHALNLAKRMTMPWNLDGSRIQILLCCFVGCVISPASLASLSLLD